jgi:hypothetical protein
MVPNSCLLSLLATKSGCGLLILRLQWTESFFRAIQTRKIRADVAEWQTQRT